MVTITGHLLQRCKAELQDLIPIECGGQAPSSTQCSTNPVTLKALCRKLYINSFEELTGNSCKFIPVHTTTAYRGSRVIAPLILNLGSGWRKVYIFTFRSLYLLKSDPDTHSIRGCVNTNPNLDLSQKRKIFLATTEDQASDRPANSLIIIQTAHP
jgi:hypothetical protein